MKNTNGSNNKKTKLYIDMIKSKYRIKIDFYTMILPGRFT